MSKYYVRVKHFSGNLNKIKEDIKKKLISLEGANVIVEGDFIKISKEDSWCNIVGKIWFEKSGKDLDIYYDSEGSWSGLALIAACLLFCVTILFVLVPWYLKNEELKRFDNSTIQILNMIANE